MLKKIQFKAVQTYWPIILLNLLFSIVIVSAINYVLITKLINDQPKQKNYLTKEDIEPIFEFNNLTLEEIATMSGEIDIINSRLGSLSKTPVVTETNSQLNQIESANALKKAQLQSKLLDKMLNEN